MVNQRYQLTVGFGSGEKGAKWDALIEKLCKRFKQDPTDVVKTALLTLERVEKSDAITAAE